MRLAAKPHGACSHARVCFLRSQESVTDAGDVSIEAWVCAVEGLGFSQIHQTSRCRAGGGERRCVGVECSTDAGPGSTVDEI